MLTEDLIGTDVPSTIVVTEPGVGTIHQLKEKVKSKKRTVVEIDAATASLVDLVTIFAVPTAMLASAEVLIVSRFEEAPEQIVSAMGTLVTNRTIAEVSFPTLQSVIFVVYEADSRNVKKLQDLIGRK